jgi:hypothetical protein
MELAAFYRVKAYRIFSEEIFRKHLILRPRWGWEANHTEIKCGVY